MRPAGHLERTLVELTVGVHQGAAQRKRALADTHFGPCLQPARVPLSGSAAAASAFTDAAVQWEDPFVYPPPQSRWPFHIPHFGYGIEMTAGQGELVVIHAHVIGWTVTEEQWYVGATVRFAISAPAADPTATAAVPYSAIAHLSFTGYAAPAEADEFAT